ncbi:MAG: hypothetical protein J5994_00285 [Ruminococcus sp.]|nr:hypothetical protein [Ruminococcus sp.]
MNKNIDFRCVGCALLCTLTFFITYYGGIFYNRTVSFAAASVITLILLVSKSFNEWGSKILIYVLTVMVLVAVFQTYSLNEFIAEKLGYSIGNYSWGELLVISNCLWFAIVMGGALVSLTVTAVIVYRRENA